MIDEKLQAELRAKYNPDGSILRKHQLAMLEMLVFFDGLCKKHNINYWLSSGTCLGAIRHGGFIPWDDDLDVEMLREDYLKLVKVFQETDLYTLQTHKTDPFYVVPYAKLRNKKSKIVEHGQDLKYKYRGIYIDIFVLEECPQIIARIYNRLTWELLLFGSKTKSKYIGEPLFFLGKFMLHKSIPFVRFLFGRHKSDYLRHTYGSGFSWNPRKRKWIFPLKNVSFEGHSFPIPNDFDSYLKTMYKEYMQLPNLDFVKPHIVEISFNE